MSDQFRIERYRRSDRESVFALLRATLPEAMADKAILQWDWKYDANPFNRAAECARRNDRLGALPILRAAMSDEEFESLGLNGAGPSIETEAEPYCLLLKTRDRLVGMLGSIPQSFMVSGQEHWVSIGCDFAIDPEFRKQKLSLRLASRLYADNAMMLGWSNPAGRGSSQSLQDRLQKASSGGPTSAFRGAMLPLRALVKPVEFGYVVGRMSGSRALGLGAAALQLGANAFQRIVHRPAVISGITINSLDTFDHRIDELWARSCRDYPVMGIRNQDYLNWRFLRRPQISYKYLAAMKGSDIVGYLIFRVADRDGIPCGFLVDYLIEDKSPAIFSLLLETAEQSMRKEGAKMIACVVAIPPYRKVLRRHGFFPAVIGGRSVQIEVGMHPADLVLHVFADLANWFVTMGDGNLEMAL